MTKSLQLWLTKEEAQYLASLINLEQIRFGTTLQRKALIDRLEEALKKAEDNGL